MTETQASEQPSDSHTEPPHNTEQPSKTHTPTKYISPSGNKSKKINYNTFDEVLRKWMMVHNVNNKI